MNWQDKRVKYSIIIAMIIVGIVGFRIVNNLMSAREKAERASQGKTVSVSTGFAERRSILPVVKLSGNLDPVWQADIAAKVAGRIEKIYAKVGDAVEAGQILAELDTGELAASAGSAEGNVFDARANLDSAVTAYARYEKLYAAGAVSQAELDNARFSRDMAAGKLASAQGTYANLVSKLNGASVTSPQAGTVVKRYYQEGYYANVGTPLYNVADISALVVKIDIPESQIASVFLGAEAKIVVPSMKNKEVKGTITKLAEVADLPARTFAAEITVDNQDKALRGGLFADVFMQADAKENALCIPQQAIVMREDQRTVYVADKDGKISRKVLDTGYIGDGYVEVLSGIDEKDEIVLTGQNKVREGSVIKRAKDDGKEK